VTSDPANPPLNLARACLERWASKAVTSREPAFTFVARDGATRRWTYAEAWALTERIGRGLLALGLAPGDRVMLRLPHSPEFAFAFFGASLAGLLPIPASPMLTPEEAWFLVDDSEAAAVISGEGMQLDGFNGLQLSDRDLGTLDGPGPLPQTRAEDPAYLIYTSGTTRRPRGVLHAHRSVHGRALMRDGWQGFRQGDVTLHAGTLNWSYTLGVGLMDPWAAGAHALLAETPAGAAAWLSLIECHGVNVFAAVPTVYRQILKHGRPEDHDLRALRHVLCAGEPLSPALLDEWRRRAGTEMYESLGMTEISTYVSSGPSTPVRPGSPGRPQAGRRIAILPEEGDSTVPLPPGQPGLLAVHRSDPGLMLGYWRRPDEEAAVFRGQWFVGGDLASIDEDGYVWFHGRADDVIKSLGYRLSPLEIEAVIEACPGVAEAAVVNLPIDSQVSLVAACVVRRDGSDLAEEALAAHVEQHLAKYKRPRIYCFLDALPRTRNGKLQRRMLVAQLTENRAAL
jgi:acyl-coenzyme A synthetase/AMP-(fatty) acid ligase